MYAGKKLILNVTLISFRHDIVQLYTFIFRNRSVDSMWSGDDFSLVIDRMMILPQLLFYITF